MRLKSIMNDKEFLSNVGIFMACFAFSFFTYNFFSPAVSSNADTLNVSDGNSVYTASISVDNNTVIAINPTSSQSIFTGTSEITYTNTCPYGFNITLSSSTSDTNLTRTGEDSETKTIPATTGTSLQDNTWGVSNDNGETYKGVPSISSPTNVLNTFEATTNPVTLNLLFGVKTDNNLPSGRYTNDVVYTVSVKPQCLTYGITWDLDGGTAAEAVYPTTLNFAQTIDLTALTPTKDGYDFIGWSNDDDDFTGEETNVNINPENLTALTMTAQWEEAIGTMQNFSCSELKNIGDSIVLKDSRDDNSYIVKKLADGKCWMTENLRIIDKTISSVDSNLPEGETWNIPVSSASGFSGYGTNNAYLDSTYGGYYTFYTATAGWGSQTNYGNATKDICPKGWRLPTGGSSGEFQTLYSNYNSSALMQNTPGFVLSGSVSYSRVEITGSGGFYWSSSVDSGTNAYFLRLYSSSVDSAISAGKYYGMSVRCVANETMQKYDVSQLVNTGDSIILIDERDGNKYLVKRLADGKVWMTQNLRIIDKTISSVDSNLPEGENWTIPASSITGFSEYNINNAYFESFNDYGSYYTFYTATAGWGTDSVRSGNAPRDICPRGWRLPTGGGMGEFKTLYNNYNSYAQMRGAPGFVLSGVVNNSSFGNSMGSYGYYWSSTVYDANFAYNLDLLFQSYADPSNYINKYYGMSVRCVAQE